MLICVINTTLIAYNIKTNKKLEQNDIKLGVVSFNVETRERLITVDLKLVGIQ